MNIERIPYKGWQDCLHLSNGTVEAVISTQIGPRVLHFSFTGQENLFAEFPEQQGLVGGDEWRIYGGHRLWHSPEAMPRSYIPDNAPVKVEQVEGLIRLVSPVEAPTGIQKEIEFHLEDGSPRVRVTHRLRNTGLWPVRLSVWALSVMRTGGVAFFPIPPRLPHSQCLLPQSILTLWSFTDFKDPRWELGSRVIMLRQDPEANTSQKVGANVPDGWAAYACCNTLFVKRFEYQTHAVYPDYGCSVELYAQKDFAEIETLSPLTNLDPGETVDHVETWTLYRDIPQPKNEEDVIRDILPIFAKP